jgi:hypothetical protein
MLTNEHTEPFKGKAEDNGFLWAIKFGSTPSFGAEVKPSVPCRKILQRVKNPYSMNEIFVGKIHGHFLSIFTCFSTRCLCWFLPESYGG